MKKKNNSFSRWLGISLSALMLVVQINATKAQTPIADASRELRRMFAPVVNPNSTVRFFYDMGAHTTDSSYFTHLNLIDTTDADNWYRIYEEVGYMAYDTTILISEDSVYNLAVPHTRNDTIPLAIMDFKYNLLKPGVLDTNIWFDFDTTANTLSDQPGRPSSPYQPIQNIFQCSPLKTSYGYTNPVFMVNPKFIFADPAPPGCNVCNKLPYTLKIDFNDGTGFHSFSSDTTSYYRPLYTTIGDKIIQFKLDSSGIMKKYSKALFKITGATALLAADSSWTIPGMTVSFFGGCEGTMQKKFVIYLEGLDVLEDRHGPDLYRTMIQNQNMADLRNLGYTFAVVDWTYSYRDIELNAMSVVGLIDTLKKRYPNLPPLVMVGESMGGLVGRFALRWMETSNYLHDQTHPHLLKMHNTRLFLTIDAPQRGANIPLAYQWFYRYAQTNPLVKAFVQPTLWHAIIGGYAPALNRPAVRQMLLYHINSNPFWLVPVDSWAYTAANDKGSLDASFASLGNDGWPQYCKKVAISNGSWLGDRQERAWDNGYRVPNDDFLKVATNTFVKVLGIKVAGTEWILAMRSNPSGDGDVFEANQSFYSYSIKLKRWGVKIGLTKHVLLGIKKRALNCIPYCVSAGSNQDMNSNLLGWVPQANKSFNILGMLGMEYNGGGGGIKVSAKVGAPFGLFSVDYTFEARSDAVDFGFIPTGSSFAFTDFESRSLDYPLIQDSTEILSKSPYDVIITNPTHHTEFTTKIPQNGNRFHLWVGNTRHDYNDYSSCNAPPTFTQLVSRLINREIGDDTLYLENTEGFIPFDIEAYNGLFVNRKNPHYNYPGDYAKFPDYEWNINGRNDIGSIVLSKDNPYRVLWGAHTFRSNDSFVQVGLNPWEYNYVPNGMIPCCFDFSVMRKTKNDTVSFVEQIENKFTLYPNPASNGQILKVDYSFSNAGLSTLNVYNMLGQKVISKRNYCDINSKICSFEIPLSLQPGVYLLRVDNGKEHHDGKFVISQ